MGVSKSTQFNNWFTPKINPTETITQIGYGTAEATTTCARNCTSIKEVIDLVTREIVYKQLNPRIITHTMAQKPTSLQELLSIANEYVADSGRGRESAWRRSSVNPQPTYQKPHRPFNGHKFQQQQPQAQNQSQTQPMNQPQTQPQINQPKPFTPFQQQGGVRPPTITSAQHGGSDGRPFKPQYKWQSSSTKIKDHCALTVRSGATSGLCVLTGMCLLCPQMTKKTSPQHQPSCPSFSWSAAFLANQSDSF